MSAPDGGCESALIAVRRTRNGEVVFVVDIDALFWGGHTPWQRHTLNGSPSVRYGPREHG
jgi:hypothetical protein